MRMAFSVVKHAGTDSTPADARWVSIADSRYRLAQMRIAARWSAA